MVELRYSEDSWLGEIPTHWAQVPAKALFSNPVERSHSDDVHLTPSQKYGVLPQADYMEITGSRVVLNLSGADNMRHVEPGDYVSHLRSFQGGLEYSDFRGKVSSAYTVLRPKKLIEPRFYKYLFKSSRYVQGLATTTEQLRDGQSIRYAQFALLPLPYPPIGEQKAIADFLEREVSQIDALIEKQHALLGLINERKLASIQEAVTAKYDSRHARRLIEGTWFGSVPDHWSVLQIRRLTPVKRGSSPRPIDDPKFFDESGEWAWVRIADASSAQGRLKNTTQRLSELGSSLSTKLEPGALFVSIAGSVGKPCITEIKCCIHDGFVYFPNLKIDPEWLFRIFEAGLCFAGLGKLGTQLNLNTDTIASITVPVPPESEITEILEKLRRSIANFNVLIESAERLIEALNERKQAIVSAAVTGKVDVLGKK